MNMWPPLLRASSHAMRAPRIRRRNVAQTSRRTASRSAPRNEIGERDVTMAARATGPLVGVTGDPSGLRIAERFRSNRFGAVAAADRSPCDLGGPGEDGVLP